ncbi:ribosome assembly protein SQT1 [Rhizodiscina lignyota]|uniref:Ribosome assembly protein SQT1 n=1 Tax=Rhizodiscina lignyota TaxID=1504668 RepID=A0A9P4IPL9_9PEZI|nr:ribosome assembly protein SQT1 [Rhizodiscina lignyota]
MSTHNPHNTDPQDDDPEDDGDAMLDPDEAGEEIENDGDVAMDSDDEGDPNAPLEEIQLQNDSVAHFDKHTDSIFCISQHPVHTNIVVTGGGDDVAYIWDSSSGRQERPVLPTSYESSPAGGVKERAGIEATQKLDGHTDSVNGVAFMFPKGEYVVTAGLDGRLRAWRDAAGTGQKWEFVADAQEVEEINWISACPSPAHPNTIALGANDGSVWIYTIDASNAPNPLTITQAFYLHTAACTAGTWSPDGSLLATVAEDSSFYVWDAFGDAAEAGLTSAGQGGGQTVVGLTEVDERFRVDGGLYSVAVSPNSSFAAVGGADGNIRIVGLPRLGAAASSQGAAGQRGGGAKNKAAAGQILASLQTQGESIESISFAQAANLTLMATASVDGSIALFDWSHNFAVRRHIKEAHEGEAVIKVEFAPAASIPVNAATAGSGRGPWLLTSCGNDGVVRVWDTRGGTAAAGQGFLRQWQGHRGGGEGGGVLGFVQDGSGRVVTAGDDGIGLVFEP